MIITIVIGLVSLGVIIFIHELGHFLTAKSFGITVESFALGWGRKLFSFRRGETEYRINIFPMGGYCRMKGEEEFRKALSEKADSFEPSPGSLFSVSPLKRLATYAAGPVSNFILAGLLLTLVWYIGYSYTTFENRVVLTGDYPQVYGYQEEIQPAEAAGIQTGDEILMINGRRVETFQDLQQIIMTEPGRELSIQLRRNDQTVETSITPRLDESTGAGYIGVGPYIEPVISEIEPGSAAEAAGLQSGDRILEVNDMPVEHSLEFYQAFADNPGRVPLTVQRNDRTLEIEYLPEYGEEGQLAQGFAFQHLQVQTPDYSILQSIGPGFSQAAETFALTIRSIGMLFRGVDASEAVAGPVRITYLVGDTTAQGFQAGLREGLITLLQLISFISIALSFANLLPIPALDGGQIILSLYESVRGKMISPKRYQILQLIGFSIIMFIFLYALMSDITFFTGAR